MTIHAKMRGQVVVVTGATSGIGEAAAEELCGRGATVYLAVRNAEKAALTMKKIRQAHPLADVHLAPPLDTSSLDSVRAFAAAWRAARRPLHVLLLNAGAFKRTTNLTRDGIAELAQINYLGAYALTRLLEDILVASRCRVISVSSVTHRMGTLGADPGRDFLRGDWGHHYVNTKLANCVFAYELQRRLGAAGVQSCAVDPGGVSSQIWRDQAWYLRGTVGLLYAPAEEGAKPLVFAATQPWDSPEAVPAGSAAVTKANGKGRGYVRLPPPQQDFRYFAPEAYALRAVTFYNAEGNRGLLGYLMMRLFSLPVTTPWGLWKQGVWSALTVAVSAIDWPVRRLTGGRIWGRVVPTHSSPLSYDAVLAAALWDASADAAGVPREALAQREKSA